MTLRIVHTAPDYLPHVGGAEVGLHTLLVASSAHHDVEHVVVAPTPDSSLVGRHQIEGIEVQRYPRPERWMHWYAPTIAASVRSPVLVLAESPDVVHASYALPTGLGALLAARKRGLPLVFTLGGNDVLDPVYPPPRPLTALAASAARRADHVVCFSTPVREHLITEWRIDSSRTSVNPFGVDVDRFHPRNGEGDALRAQWGCREDSFVIVAVQRLARRKGLDLLLDAIAKMRRSDLEVLIGGRGPDADSLWAQAKELEITDSVRFLGFIPDEDKPGLLAMADLFVLPSRYEGQGIAIAEAAASGTAVVATRCGGTVDMVDDEVTGWLVAPDAGSLAEALDHAAQDPSRCSDLGLAGRRKAELSLSLRVTSDRFVEVLRSVC